MAARNLSKPPRLLPGYRLDDTDPDLVRLVAPNGKSAAVFGPSAEPSEIERECYERAAKVDSAVGLVERLLGRSA